MRTAERAAKHERENGLGTTQVPLLKILPAYGGARRSCERVHKRRKARSVPLTPCLTARF